jgi:AraC family transcriptional regulator
MAFIRQNFRTATLADVAAHVGISQFYFHRLFTAWSGGRTPKDVMTELQIGHAKELILGGAVELRDVAARCGFSHQSHLTSRFRDLVGMPPSRWRKARQSEALDRRRSNVAAVAKAAA